MDHNSTTKRFYVYVLARPDGRPFYVGKGSGYRIEDHEYEAARGHKCKKCNIIRKVWATGGKIQRYIILSTDDEQEAFAYERETIAMYGRQVLANLSDGGDGASGAVRSAETRARQSEAAKRRWANNPEARARQGAKSKARWADPEHRAVMETANREVQSRPEVSQRKAATRQRFYEEHPELRESIGDGSRAYWSQPESRTAASARMRATWERRKAKDETK